MNGNCELNDTPSGRRDCSTIDGVNLGLNSELWLAASAFCAAGSNCTSTCLSAGRLSGVPNLAWFTAT